MYCPSCGRTTSSKQRYCRSCGLDLDDINRMLAKNAPEPEEDQGQQDSAGNFDWLKKAAYLSCLTGIALIAFSIIFLLVTIFIPGAIERGSPVGIMVSTAILLFLLGAMFAAPYTYYKRFHKSRAGRRQRQTPTNLTLTEANTRQLGESRFEPITSVAEPTTELLSAIRKREDG